LTLRKVEDVSMHQKPKVPAEWSHRRTRHDPPDLYDAIAAAQGLTDHIDSQIEIAAQLIGLPEDEVRPAVLKSVAQFHANQVAPAPVSPNSRRVVVIERRSPRARLTRT
jgi:hypothetical protein